MVNCPCSSVPDFQCFGCVWCWRTPKFPRWIPTCSFVIRKSLSLALRNPHMYPHFSWSSIRFIPLGSPFRSLWLVGNPSEIHRFAGVDFFKMHRWEGSYSLPLLWKKLSHPPREILMTCIGFVAFCQLKGGVSDYIGHAFVRPCLVVKATGFPLRALNAPSLITCQQSLN